ncbi:MAG: glycosyltransferase family 9 protein [Candidatus Neomarinimicrobiota bacterium]
MAEQTVSQARSLRSNPRHYPRKLLVNLYNFCTGRQPRKPLPETPESILIQAPEKLGDAVLLLPLLKGLIEKFPALRLDIISSTKSSYLFEELPFVSAVLKYRSPGQNLKEQLAGRQFHIFYNPKDHPSITAFQLARLVKADVKVCLYHEKHNQHYNYSLPNRESSPIVEKNGELLRAYGVKFPLKNFFPVKKLKSRGSSKLIALNVSSGDKNRIWPLENWLKLVQEIIDLDEKFSFLLFAMKPEHSSAEIMKEKFNEKIEYPLFSPHLFEAGSIIQNCDLLISADTALVHVAAAVGTPVLGLYSGDKRNRERYIPYRIDFEIVNSVRLNIKDVKPEEVITAFRSIIKRI